MIMAAGLGSRFGGDKQIARLGPNGEMLLEYSIYDAVEAGFDKIVFIIRKEMAQKFEECIGNKIASKVDVQYAYQEEDTLPKGFTIPLARTKPYGTVHAVYCAKDVINEPFAVINADDYYGKSAFQIMHRSLTSLPFKGRASMVSYMLKNTVSKSGAVTRGICSQNDDNTLAKVIETYAIKPCDDGTIRDFQTDDKGIILDKNALVSMNFWGFTPWIFEQIGKQLAAFMKTLAADELNKEYPLPAMIDKMMQEKLLCVDVLKTDAIWFGVTYPEDRDYVHAQLEKLHNECMYPTKL